MLIDHRVVTLKEKITMQSQLVERMIALSIDILLQKKADILPEILRFEEKVNLEENIIDKLCAETLALFQPEAKNLRTVLMIFKMNTDLERIGDMAAKIAEYATKLHSFQQEKPFEFIPKMAEEATGMLHDAIASFVSGDTDLALQTCSRDVVVNDYNSKVYDNVMNLMKQDPALVEDCVNLMRISKNLERIADISTNIAEKAIYMVDGKDIKHQIKTNK